MVERDKPERADFFEPGHEGFFGDHVARYEFVSHFVREKRVIDAACGSGHGTMRLKLAGASLSLGIDLDGPTIHRNQRLYGPQNVDFLEADCETCDLSTYRPDVVASFETIEHLRDPAAFLRGVANALHDDGVLVVSCPNDEKLGENPYHFHSWDASSLRDLLERYFGDVVVLGQVLTPCASANAELGRFLDSRVGVLWRQPWTRAWRAIRRMLSREPVPSRPEWSSIIPSPHDWWFIPETGKDAVCLLAICRHART